jgi:hypothetical protein
MVCFVMGNICSLIASIDYAVDVANLAEGDPLPDQSVFFPWVPFYVLVVPSIILGWVVDKYGFIKYRRNRERKMLAAAAAAAGAAPAAGQPAKMVAQMTSIVSAFKKTSMKDGDGAATLFRKKSIGESGLMKFSQKSGSGKVMPMMDSVFMSSGPALIISDDVHVDEGSNGHQNTDEPTAEEVRVVDIAEENQSGQEDESKFRQGGEQGAKIEPLEDQGATSQNSPERHASVGDDAV